MLSPFPGMDPYLEGYLWPDVHNALAAKIRQMLAPLLRPRYAARLGIYVVEDVTPEVDIGILYPDIQITQKRLSEAAVVPALSLASAAHTRAVTPATLTVPVILPVEVQLATVEIHDAANNQLVTSIEIISPVNKREPGLTQYRQKRRRLYQAGVHLVELDLLRRGVRPLASPRGHATDYMIGLTRAVSGRTDLWLITVRDSLPIIPVPLHDPDEDIVLDLPAAMNAVYEEAGYDLSVDYGQDPPPPALAPGDRDWMQVLFDSWAHARDGC